MTTIPFSHALDAVTHVLGELTEVSATAAIRLPRVRASDGDQTYEKTTPDQLVIAGTLESGAVLSAHYRGGLSRGTKLLWEINGTDGDLQLIGDHQLQVSELTLSAGRGEDERLAPLEVPARYRCADPSLTNRAANVAEAYLRIEEDLRTGSRTAPSFDDAVTRHRMVHAVLEAAQSGQKQSLGRKSA
jgi:predicted dehydrogenase